MEHEKTIAKFKEFFDRSYLPEIYNHKLRGKKMVVIDFKNLILFDVSLANQILDEPEESLKCAEVAIEEYDIKKPFHVRIKNISEDCRKNISDLRSIDLNKLLKVEGIISTRTNVYPNIISTTFECPSCGNFITVLQLDKILNEPTRCGCGFKGRFIPREKELIDCTSMVLEEPTDLISSIKTQSIPILLKDDLTEEHLDRRLYQGIRVEIIGILKEKFVTERGNKQTKLETYIEVIYVKIFDDDYTNIILSPKDIEDIKEISKKPNLLKYLSEKMFVDIEGYEHEKKALCLALVGGVKGGIKKKVPVRGDIHILMCGDPSTAKSTFIGILENIAPKSKRVSNLSSKAGLTGAAIKDELLGQWALEAGALALAHKGVCLIDEIDKMDEEARNGLHEAMEQQFITINKATIHAKLLTETTVISAANPKGGRFDKYNLDKKGVIEQINFPPTLLSRFDYIFTFIDTPDEHRDRKIAEKILRRGLESSKEEDEISIDILKKYVVYARKLTPKINLNFNDDNKLMNKVVESYVRLRKIKNQDSAGAQIFSRQLESIRRSAEAIAKIHLREKDVTEEDVDEAIFLIMYSLKQVAIDPETGKLDVDMIESGTTYSQRKHIYDIKNIIEELSDINKLIFIDDIIFKCKEKGIQSYITEEIIEKMKRNGDLIEPRTGFISKM